MMLNLAWLFLLAAAPPQDAPAQQAPAQPAQPVQQAQPAQPVQQAPAPPTAAQLLKLLEEQQHAQDERNRAYEERIRQLEESLGTLRLDADVRRHEDELDELLRLAEASGPPPVARPSTTPSFLNPQISLIPDFVTRWHDVKIHGSPAAIEAAFPELFSEENPFTLRDTEIDIRAPVSPEADAVAILGVGDDEAAFEEAYILFHALPFGIAAKVGKFLLEFGRANNIHQHDLMQVDRPIVHRLLFGDEGTSSPGISLTKVLFTSAPGGLLPAYSRLTVEGINSINEEAPLFGDEAENEAAVNMRWMNFWQLTQNSDLEQGVSFLASPNNKSGLHEATTLLGADLTWRWTDPRPGVYNAWLVQGELIGSSVDEAESADSIDALGGYFTVQKQLDPQWYAGMRLDAAQSPFVEEASVFGIAPYVTHYLNEFIRFRLQYNYMSGEAGDSDAVNHGLSAQLTWVFGAHPPEPYWVNK